MKRRLLYLTTLLLFTFFHLSAQTDVVTGLNQPTKILLNGNDLYITEFGVDKVFKIDLTSLFLTAIDVLLGGGSARVFFNGNDLFYNGITKMYNVDITASSPVIINVIKGLIYRMKF